MRIRRILLIAILVAWSAFSYTVIYTRWYLPSLPPEIGRGLPSSFETADSIFKERVREAFPLPMSEADLVSRLREDGFEIRVGTEFSIARFERPWFFCNLEWHINWTASEGQVTSIHPVYGGTCP